IAFEHSVMTVLKSWFMVTVKSQFLKTCFMLLDTFNFSGKSTNLGSGDHHKMGCPVSNQGKTPLLYARTNRSTERSPPTASKPSGSASWTSGKLNFDVK